MDQIVYKRGYVPTIKVSFGLPLVLCVVLPCVSRLESLPFESEYSQYPSEYILAARQRFQVTSSVPCVAQAHFAHLSQSDVWNTIFNNKSTNIRGHCRTVSYSHCRVSRAQFMYILVPCHTDTRCHTVPVCNKRHQPYNILGSAHL